MRRADSTDLFVLAERLRQGIPDRGFDGRPIPLQDEDGACLTAVDAALLLLESGVALLDPVDRRTFRLAALERASAVEMVAAADGVSEAGIAERVTAVLVSAAVRAQVLGRGDDISPTGINRATLAWYDRSRLRAAELIAALHHPVPASRPA